jgi:hypothetical protein
MTYLVLAVIAGALYWDSKRANPLVWGKVKEFWAKFKAE